MCTFDTTGRDGLLTVQIVQFRDVAREPETPDRRAEVESVTIEHDPSPATH